MCVSLYLSLSISFFLFLALSNILSHFLSLSHALFFRSISFASNSVPCSWDLKGVWSSHVNSPVNACDKNDSKKPALISDIPSHSLPVSVSLCLSLSLFLTLSLSSPPPLSVSLYLFLSHFLSLNSSSPLSFSLLLSHFLFSSFRSIRLLPSLWISCTVPIPQSPIQA